MEIKPLVLAFAAFLSAAGPLSGADGSSALAGKST